MAGITEESIERLKSAIDIRAVIEQRVRLKPSGSGRWLGLCPFHEEKTPSFTVDSNKGMYHCFGCKESGDAIKFVRESGNLDFVSAIEELANQFGVMLERTESRSQRSKVQDQKRDKARDFLDVLSQYYHSELKSHPPTQKYLKKRGITDWEVQHYSLGYAPPGGLQKVFGKHEKLLKEVGALSQKGFDLMGGRLVFPIHSRKGNVIGFGGRLLQGDGPKYINYGETEYFHKRRELYGLHDALTCRPRPKGLVVVEGYMDAIAAARAARANPELPMPVAVLGTALTQDHVRAMVRSFSDLVLCFDGDTAGQKAAFSSLSSFSPVLRDGITVKLALLPDGEDPDTLVCSGKWQQTLEETRLGLSRWLAQYLQKHSGDDEQLAALKAIIDQLKPLQESLLRADIAAKLAHAMDPPWRQDRVEQALADASGSERARRWQAGSSRQGFAPGGVQAGNRPPADAPGKPPNHEEKSLKDLSLRVDADGDGFEFPEANPEGALPAKPINVRGFDDAILGMAKRLFANEKRMRLVAGVLGKFGWLPQATESAKAFHAVWGEVLEAFEQEEDPSGILTMKEVAWRDERSEWSGIVRGWRGAAISQEDPSPSQILEEILHYCEAAAKASCSKGVMVAWLVELDGAVETSLEGVIESDADRNRWKEVVANKIAKLRRRGWDKPEPQPPQEPAEEPLMELVSDQASGSD